MTATIHEHCRSLLAALEELETGGGDEADRIIAAHLASCAVCAGEERRLGQLLADYRRTVTSPMPAGMVERLLDRLCPRD